MPTTDDNGADALASMAIEEVLEQAAYLLETRVGRTPITGNAAARMLRQLSVDARTRLHRAGNTSNASNGQGGQAC